VTFGNRAQSSETSRRTLSLSRFDQLVVRESSPIKFLVRICSRGLFPDDRSNAGSQKFDRPQHLLVRERRDTHLERNSRKASQDVVHVQDLLRDRFRIADQQGARGSPQSVKLCPSRWWPAAFFADLRERVGISRVEIVCSSLCGVSKKADCEVRQ
jgi:hypothetical protein